ncbi:DUF4242 domain-containing protein [Algibacter mikhailovii]|uniref:DUF4242 domain-containing protein n=1 Tax=Algibacter mikhailovii TaxID=425498 RepID=A0A918R5K7_9FLAO|nr:DUF4242 domain-containing protein [Algibacter mikhailovii]GGZ86718.1 hypothetical protein GCM10007028_26020 [Algibacter mikhailovii]
MKTIQIILVLIVFTMHYTQAQQKNQSAIKNNDSMKTYVIERIIPGAGNLTPEQLKAISQTSCTVLKEMGPRISWQHSYVTGDKVYCVYKAENKETIDEHAKKGGFPANSVNEVATIISPVTAEQ